MEIAFRKPCNIRRITPVDGGCYFFGYYDNPGWSVDGRLHLCHRVSFMDRIPTANDTASLGLADVDRGSFEPVAVTRAWNFQQGSMLQWNPRKPNEEILYNVFEDGAYRTAICNLRTGSIRLLERPVANVDPTGNYGVSINFDRMYDFRPGYGYAHGPDRHAGQKHPEEDGIFLIDMLTGKSRLVLSLEQIWQLVKKSFDNRDPKLLINHINFNTDGTRLVCLVRNFPEVNGEWLTAILTVNRDGSQPFLLSDFAYASHYHWKNACELVIHSSGAEIGQLGNQLYELRDQTYAGTALNTDFFRKDGHCSYSPDRTYMLYDSYPDSNNLRHLYMYDLINKQGTEIGSFYSDPAVTGDFRCDLHPRWSPKGEAISFDSIHEGSRHMYVAER